MKLEKFKKNELKNLECILGGKKQTTGAGLMAGCHNGVDVTFSWTSDECLNDGSCRYYDWVVLR